MTQPSPHDDLPPGPWFVGSLPPPEWRYICDANGNVIAAVAEWDKDGNLIQEFGGAKQAKAVARAIAAIPEMREELDRLSVEIETLRAQMHGMQDGSLVRDQNTEIDRLRVEKAELREALEDLLNLKQGCHERAEAILDRLTNETEGK